MNKANTLTTELWQTILNLHKFIFNIVPTETRQAIIQPLYVYGIIEPRYFFHLVYVAENFDPFDLSLEAYAKRDPFDHLAITENYFNEWQKQKLIYKDENNKLRITPLFETYREARWNLLNDTLGKHSLNKDQSLNKVLGQFEKVKTAVFQATPLSKRYNFQTRIELGLRSPQDICPLLQFIEYRMDFGALRDDVHLEAWDVVAPELPPIAREMSSLVDGGLTDLNNLIEQQKRRGFEREAYETAVTQLIQNQWLKKDQNLLRLTQLGQEKRAQVEELTNKEFYKPWRHTLTDPEIEQFKENLEYLRKELGGE